MKHIWTSCAKGLEMTAHQPPRYFKQSNENQVKTYLRSICRKTGAFLTPIFRKKQDSHLRNIMYPSSRSAPPASPSLHTILPKLPILSVVSPLPVLAGAALLVLFFESKNLPHIPFRYNQNVQGIKVYPAKPL